MCELGGERDVCDGYVVKDYVEPQRTIGQILSHKSRYLREQ